MYDNNEIKYCNLCSQTVIKSNYLKAIVSMMLEENLLIIDKKGNIEYLEKVPNNYLIIDRKLNPFF